MRKREYAIYRGDEFVDVGTAAELAERMHVRTGTIYSLASRGSRGRDRGNRLVAYALEDEDGEERRTEGNGRKNR